PVRRWAGQLAGAPWWADGSQDATASVLWGYSAPPAGGPQKTYIVTEWHAPRCYGNFVRKQYDGLGQLVVEQRPDQQWETVVDGCGAANQGQEIDTYYLYDAFGQPVRTSVPTLVSRAGFNTRALGAPATWGAGYTATTYDLLGRPTQITTPNGEQTLFDYAGR